MGLSEVQRGLAQLLTAPALRSRFVVDPQSVGREMGLSGEDIGLLQAFSLSEVERCAASLQAKRWLEIKKLLPLSICAAECGQAPLVTLFRQFAQTFVPQGSKRHAQDAIAFAEWAAQQPAKGVGRRKSGCKDGVTQKDVPEEYFSEQYCYRDWLPDLLRYEAAWLTSHLDRRARFCLVRRFRFPVHQINPQFLTSAVGENALVQVPPQPVIAFWLRTSPNAKIWFTARTWSFFPRQALSCRVPGADNH